MGLYVRLNVQVDQIDAERWEAVWLTSLQLLEQFPGPLAARIVDAQHESRFVLSSRLQLEVGTKAEHWQADGDLGSGRFAETYCLYRHLSHYRRNSGGRNAGKTVDVLWLPAKDLEAGEMGGWTVFDAKSQGYPYHYAMLAVAILVENSFPGRALVHGDISRAQAEHIVPWAEAVLGRPLRLPVVTDGARLWQRLAEAYAGEPDLAVRRFLTLSAEDRGPAWRVLAQLDSGPNAAVLRRAYQSEMARYESLRQRGAQALIAALGEADGGLDRVIDWVCGPSGLEQPSRFTPEDLLECLCDLLLPIPLDEREVLDALTPPADQLPTIETMVSEAFSGLMGKPVACGLYMDEESIAVAFAARWPEKADSFRERLDERLAKTREKLAETRTLLDKRLPASNPRHEEEDAVRFSPGTDDGAAYHPAAEFLYAEIVRQRRRPPRPRDFAREFGGQMRTGIAKNHDFRRDLEASSRQQLVRQISLASRKHGFTLRESAWRALDQATTEELRHLTMLALVPEREVSFWEARLHLLEAPELWPVLAGTLSD